MTDQDDEQGFDEKVEDIKKAYDRRQARRKAKGFVDGDWRNNLIRGGKGKVQENYSNALLYLQNDPALATLFSYNQMRCEPMITKSQPTIITDYDINKTWAYLQSNGLPNIARSTVHHAINSRAYERPYHPILDYLNALQWDSEARVDRWLINYLDSPDSEYHHLVGRLFLVQAVARIFLPGCKADFMVILEGQQGIRKSMACQRLFGTEYYSDNLKLHQIGTKEASQHLRGKWCIEFSEMDGLSKIDASSLKAFTTRERERYRPPYGLMEVDEPRQCVFMGTSNKDVYLRDETGNRRFWGAPTGNINIETILADRDQLWAEAVMMFKRGDQRWPTDAEQKQFIEPQQDARYEDDVWTDSIVAYLRDSVFAESDGYKRITIPRIAKGALDIDIGRADQLTQKRIGAVLRKQGWVTYRTKTERGWISPHQWSGDTS